MRHVLAYDSGCGPCTRFRNVVEFLDAKHRMRYVGLAEADRGGVLDAVDPGRRHRSFHLISPAGKVWSGPSAFPELASLLPGGLLLSRALATCPPLFSFAALVYGAFSRLHDSGSCGYAPGGATPSGRTSGVLAPPPGLRGPRAGHASRCSDRTAGQPYQRRPGGAQRRRTAGPEPPWVTF